MIHQKTVIVGPRNSSMTLDRPKAAVSVDVRARELGTDRRSLAAGRSPWISGNRQSRRRCSSKGPTPGWRSTGTGRSATVDAWRVRTRPSRCRWTGICWPYWAKSPGRTPPDHPSGTFWPARQQRPRKRRPLAASSRSARHEQIRRSERNPSEERVQITRSCPERAASKAIRFDKTSSRSSKGINEQSVLPYYNIVILSISLILSPFFNKPVMKSNVSQNKTRVFYLLHHRPIPSVSHSDVVNEFLIFLRWRVCVCVWYRWTFHSRQWCNGRDVLLPF